jgi:hypothetical protein
MDYQLMKDLKLIDARPEGRSVFSLTVPRYLSNMNGNRPSSGSASGERARVLSCCEGGKQVFWKKKKKKNHITILMREHHSQTDSLHGGGAALLLDMCTMSALGPLAKMDFWLFLGGLTRSLCVPLSPKRSPGC